MSIGWLVANKEFLTLIVSFITVVIPLAMFFISKDKEQKLINFEKFHKDLMYGLSNQAGTLGLDQQVAIIYELRNYPEYYSVSRRILLAQIVRWNEKLKSKPHYYQLIDEANRTIKFSQMSFISRVLAKISSKNE